MKKILSVACVFLSLSSNGFAKEDSCYTEKMKFEKQCVDALAAACEKDWRDAVFISGSCGEFAMKYDIGKYSDMAMVALKRTFVMVKYEGGGAYMSYYPTVDIDFEEKARKTLFKNLDSLHEKPISKKEYKTYICGTLPKKECKQKMEVYEQLTKYIFDSFHAYYKNHPKRERLSQKEQKMLIEKHIKKHVKKSDKKWVKILQKEGKLLR